MKAKKINLNQPFREEKKKAGTSFLVLMLSITSNNYTMNIK